MHHLETREQDPKEMISFLPLAVVKSNEKRQSCWHSGRKKKKKKKSAGNHGDHKKRLSESPVAAFRGNRCLPCNSSMRSVVQTQLRALWSFVLMIMPPLSHGRPLNVPAKEARRAMGS